MTNPMDDLRPRPAAAADAAAVARCVEAAYSPYVERIGERPGPMLDHYPQVVRDHRVFVVESGGEIAGAIVLIEERGTVLLDNVAVLPSRQGEGIGRRLMLLAEEEARRLGYTNDHWLKPMPITAGGLLPRLRGRPGGGPLARQRKRRRQRRHS